MDVWEGYNMYKQQGFHLGLWPFLNPLVIKFVLKSVCYAPFLQWSAQLQIVLSIRLLCSLLTMVCVIVSNIVHQVTMLPSFTGNLHCCASGCCAPFYHKWSLTICDGCFDTLKSSKMRSQTSDKRFC